MKIIVMNIDKAIEMVGDFEMNATQDTFRLLFGERRGLELFTIWRVRCNFSLTALYFCLKRDDRKRLTDFIESERVEA